MNGMENRNLKYFNCLLVLSPKYKYKYYDVMNGMSIFTICLCLILQVQIVQSVQRLKGT